MIVWLSWNEARRAAYDGCDRRIRALARKRVARNGSAPGWDNDIVGMLGELAVARMLDRYPSIGPDLDRGGDIGKFQVRSTSRVDGHLWIHKHDPDDTIVVFVRGPVDVDKVRGLAFEVVGWLRAGDGKRAEYWIESGRQWPCYWIPPEIVEPIAALPPS